MNTTLLFSGFRRWLALSLCLLAGAASAQEQQTGVCAPVKMQILQQLTLERVGFLATLTITDNTGNDPITDFAANLTFENPLLSTNGVNDSSSLFFVQPPTLQNIQDVNGGGVIQPGQTATISWFIIPATGAGGTTPNGVRFNVGASLSGSVNGVPIPLASFQVVPAQINVTPDAQLQITYFTPRDTIGVDPFTGQGSPIPFTFGVLVQNVGYGPAQSVIINSQQPQITDNVQNLPLVAQLLGTRVNDSALSNADLTVNLGNLNPGQTTKGAWDMITEFSGTFLSVSANYTHSTALGGKETSLIQSVNAYLFLHEVLDDQPGRDNVRDFLTDASGTLDVIKNLIPDSLYESQGGVYPVNFLTNAVVSVSGNPAQVSLNANVAGWGYLRLNDPGQAKLPIASVVRSDGKVLNTNNYWTNIHYEPTNNIKDTYLNIFDLVNQGTYTYTVTYTNIGVNTNPPVTTLMFAGPVVFTNGAYYITPATQMYFTSQDASPLTIYYSLTNGPFQIAIPFTLSNPGQYLVTYYAQDINGLQESNHTATLILPGTGSLGFASTSVPAQPLYAPGGALSVRPGAIPLSFQASADATAVNAQLDVFQGVVGWATVSNAPASPTASTTATLSVGGVNVDYYIYQLNGNAWSAEQPVGTPLFLSGLAAGSNSVSVLGRSQYGAYMSAASATTVSWVVNSAAPATTISGAPATPASGYGAVLSVGGAGVTDYRWTLDNNYYRATASVSSPIVESNLAAGPHVISVLGGTNGVDQATNVPTSVAWTVNPLYGYDLSALTNVTTVVFTNIGTGTVNYSWNGANAAGIAKPPGWYTVRITLADQLGNTNFVVGLVQIGALSGTNLVLANFNRGPQGPQGRGRWVVWQDQSDGNWEIYAQDVTASNAAIVKVTNTPLSQENPRTDGRYVVWQAQQANGNWDVYIDDLEGTNGPQSITRTLTLDEVNPTIDWPWVVFQVRATGNSSAPWQLYAVNLATNLPSFAVAPSGQNELSPDVQAGRVVWQDLRNQGAGEIYLYGLETGVLQRLTTNSFGKYNPAIDGHWVVWQDSRNVTLDIYGFDLLRNVEVQVTATSENESQPYLSGPWLVCMGDGLGSQTGNARLIHLPSLLSVPITSTATFKTMPSLADGWAVWQETISNQSRIAAVSLPSLQAVFQNHNAVLVTPAMVTYAQTAYNLLALWGTNGLQSVTQYTSLTPSVASQTAYLTNGLPAGVNFNLVAGTFLWVQFSREQVLDLGLNASSPASLAAGVSVLGYSGFPDAYSAYQLLRQLGLNNALAVRMLDASDGRWRVAEVQNGALVGEDFPIPRVAVLLLNLQNSVNSFTPQSQP
jgi:beta propeller repeat protein